MGLFSRSEPSSGTGRRSAARTSSEAQAAELRIRARRRLIGALVLVLTAVIFVPMLFDSPPEEELASPVVLPEPIPPVPNEPQVALAPEPTPPMDGGSIAAAQESPASEPVDAPATDTPEPEVPAEPETTVREPEEPAESPTTTTANKEEQSKPEPSKPAQPAREQRTDDGAVALALLEGRQPPAASSTPPKASSGNFVLQVAAYTTDKDAQSRREKLASAGVTNAYVEQASVANGKTAYRLRVGPFPTREAAEAAQARLRQLGYNNGLIFTK